MYAHKGQDCYTPTFSRVPNSRHPAYAPKCLEVEFSDVVRRLGTRVKISRMSDRLNDLELEILDVLRMDPETAELLTEMVAPEEGGTLTEDEVRSALDRLSVRGLVRPLRGWAADASSAERVEAYWWDLTDEGRALAESGPSAGF